MTTSSTLRRILSEGRNETGYLVEYASVWVKGRKGAEANDSVEVDFGDHEVAWTM